MCQFDKDKSGTSIDRRAVLKAGAATVAAAAVLPGFASADGNDKYAPPTEPALPPATMKLNLERTALVVTDPSVLQAP